MVIASRLRHKITVQQSTQTQDSYGAVTDSWSTYCIRRAEIMSMSGQESVTSQQIFGQRPVKFRIRHDSLTEDITTKMRVSWDSRTFDIQSVENVNGRNRELILTCLERNV